MDLKGKNIVITGGSKGIGQAAAVEFARKGSNIIITYNTDKKGAEETIDLCKGFGVQAKGFQLDVTDNKAIKDLAKVIKEEFNIDVLVNNAGIISWKKFEDQSQDEINLQIDTNVRGLIDVTRSFYKEIEKAKGAIINISSGAGKMGFGELSVYCATKFAVRGFTQALSQEVIDAKIISVNPGMTSTQMTNFKGVPVDQVGEVIVKAASGEIQPDAKGDIDVWDYV